MTHPVRAAIEARDLDALAALFSDDIVFNSPVAFHPFVGRATVAEVLANVLEVFTDFVYVDELEATARTAWSSPPASADAPCRVSTTCASTMLVW